MANKEEYLWRNGMKDEPKQDLLQRNLLQALFCFKNSCYAKAPLSPMLKAESNSIARFSDAR
jgi:hypothetical protein